MADKQRFFDLLDQMRETFIAKNKDYAGEGSHDDGDFLANFKEANQLGVSASTGILIRIGDKWKRVQNLTNYGRANVKDESRRDTLMDMAVYSLLCICAMDEEKEPPKMVMVGTPKPGATVLMVPESEVRGHSGHKQREE